MLFNSFELNLVNPFKPEFTIVIFIHYKPRIAVGISRLVVDEDELTRFKNYRKMSCIGKPVSWEFSF